MSLRLARETDFLSGTQVTLRRLRVQKTLPLTCVLVRRYLLTYMVVKLTQQHAFSFLTLRINSHTGLQVTGIGTVGIYILYF